MTQPATPTRRARRAARATPLERQLRGDALAAKVTPIDAFELARRKFLAGGRIDMGQLAAELGLHRTTLYRWVGTRDRLIGEVLWSIAEPAAREADRAAQAAGARGGERIARGVERYLKASHEAEFMRRFLTEEPEAALRIITTKDSVLQGRSVEYTQRLIEEEVERGNLEPPMDPHDLAYLIVRIGESFNYTDMITGEDPAPEKAGQAVRALLR
jgi:AcrR family transcriptional regulator